MVNMIASNHGWITKWTKWTTIPEAQTSTSPLKPQVYCVEIQFGNTFK